MQGTRPHTFLTVLKGFVGNKKQHLLIIHAGPYVPDKGSGVVLFSWQDSSSVCVHSGRGGSVYTVISRVKGMY